MCQICANGWAQLTKRNHNMKAHRRCKQYNENMAKQSNCKHTHTHICICISIDTRTVGRRSGLPQNVRSINGVTTQERSRSRIYARATNPISFKMFNDTRAYKVDMLSMSGILSKIWFYKTKGQMQFSEISTMFKQRQAKGSERNTQSRDSCWRNLAWICKFIYKRNKAWGKKMKNKCPTF